MATLPIVRLLRTHAERLGAGEELSGREIAEAVSLLAAHEVREGGPYGASIGASAADLGLTLLAARFLHAAGVQLPNVDAYLAEALVAPEHASSALAADALAEEIARYRERKTAAPAPSRDSRTPRESHVLDAVHAAMERRLRGVGREVAEGVRFVIDRTIRGNADGQMALMPEYMRAALGTEYADDSALGELGFANVCFWSSFIVYDDFWDEDEAARPFLLPAANLMARHYLRHFDMLLPGDAAFNQLFHGLMDALDAANAWETVHCRMPVSDGVVQVPERLPAYGDFGIKFYPAAGHVLGPVSQLVREGYAADSRETATLIEYFRHYLIAMQLNDDAHDWKEDLGRGHISTAVYVLLEAWRQRHPSRQHIDLSVDIPELEQLFWFAALDPLCAQILDRCARAQAALDQLTFLTDAAPLARFISRNEAVARQAIRERARGDEFLAAIS